MTEIGIALVAMAAGLAVGAAVVALRRPPDPAGSGRVEARLEVQAAELRRLADAAAVRDGGTERVRAEIAAARRVLESLRIRDEERRAADGESREVVRRLATVLAGGAGKGRAGENVLRQHLSELPPSMLAADFRVGGKVVEFGLVLADGRRLPIDSKWTGLAELEALEASTTAVDREVCARAVERAVALRAREVAKYLDPALTAPVAVAAIPDAAYQVLKRAHADAFARDVVVVPYSTALPIVLFLYALVQRFGDTADVSASLAEVSTLLGDMEGVLENKFARAATMLANGSDELRSHLGKARGSIARAHAAEASVGGPEALSVVR
jgi:RmuC family protein